VAADEVYVPLVRVTVPEGETVEPSGPVAEPVTFTTTERDWLLATVEDAGVTVTVGLVAPTPEPQ
jgi:hypothetical protein